MTRATQHGRGLLRLSLAMVLGVGVALAAPFASAAPTIAEVAAYQGADRMARLVEGAKREGTLNLYSSATVEDMKILTDQFEKTYGVTVRLWRGSSENLVQRAVVESRANRHEADVYETDGVELEALHRERLLQAIDSPVLAELLPHAVPAHREWVGTRLNVFTVGYNTDRVRKEDLPRTYADLLDPKWKGKLGIEAEDVDWLATIATTEGEEKTLALFRAIAKTNGVSVRKGHTLLANLVASGEVPMGLTLYNYKIDQLRHGGAPVDWFFLPPVVARVNGAGVSRTAPHPHAAVLFFDFLLSDGQKILAARDFWPTNRAADTRTGMVEPVFSDPAAMIDGNAKWAKIYRDIFITQPR